MTEDYCHGFEEYFYFEPEGTVLYVFDIIKDFFLRAEVIAAADLGETGDAGLNFEAFAEAVDVLLEGIVEDFAFGARAYERELTGYAGPELRELVHAGFAEDRADLRDARVVISV